MDRPHEGNQSRDHAACGARITRSAIHAAAAVPVPEATNAACQPNWKRVRVPVFRINSLMRLLSVAEEMPNSAAIALSLRPVDNKGINAAANSSSSALSALALPRASMMG